MSNNVMWLVNDRTNERIPIAKYYPSTGWYLLDGHDEKLSAAFDGDSKRGAIGPVEWKIYYDMTQEMIDA